jgi:multimeric flavodoxin WrbA
LGKALSNSAPFVSILAASIHRSRYALAEVLKSFSETSSLKSPIHPSLPHAIVILGQIVRHQVNGGRYNELCPPALEALCPVEDMTFFVDLAELLKDSSGANGKPTRFGMFRNQMLELIEGLYSCGYQKIHEKLFSANVFAVLMDVFMSRSNNTILHQKVASIIRDVLQCNSKELLVEFIKHYGLVDKLVDSFDRYEGTMGNIREFNALDYYPHLFQVVLRLDLVAKMAPRYQLLADYLAAHEGWKRFVNSNLYKNYDEALKKKLLKEQGAFYIRKKPNVRR